MILAKRAQAGQIRLGTYTLRCSDPWVTERQASPVVYEIGKELGLPVDVFVVRKLGVEDQEESCNGAIATSDINYEVVDQTIASGESGRRSSHPSSDHMG